MLHASSSPHAALPVVGLLLAVLLLTAVPSLAQGRGWQVNEGPAERHSFGRTVADGDFEGFLSGAQVPAANAAGWTSASTTRALRWSGTGGTPCRSQANYTYFQTSLRPRAGRSYTIEFTNVDDAASVSVTAGTGTVNIPEVVGLRETKTIDLTPFLEAGVPNRVVITLADVCGAGNAIGAQLRVVRDGSAGDDGDDAGEDDDMAPAASAPVAAATVPSGWFRLKTQDRGAGECLEGNGPDSPVHGGAAFMDTCQGVSGQIWRATSRGDGYFVLTTQLHGDDRALESNNAESPAHNGGAFMDTTQDVTGQQWRAVDAGNGFFRLQSRWRGDGECLEGNGSASPVHGGSSFMDACQNVSGQLWQFVPE